MCGERAHSARMCLWARMRTTWVPAGSEAHGSGNLGITFLGLSFLTCKMEVIMVLGLWPPASPHSHLPCPHCLPPLPHHHPLSTPDLRPLQAFALTIPFVPNALPPDTHTANSHASQNECLSKYHPLGEAYLDQPQNSQPRLPATLSVALSPCLPHGLPWSLSGLPCGLSTSQSSLFGSLLCPWCPVQSLA